MGFLIGLLCGIVSATVVVYWATRRASRRFRAMEQRTRTAERLAELGTMTGGLAHEIKNPLSTIGLNLQLLRESIRDSQLPATDKPRLLNRLDAVTAETDRLRGILEDFLAFAGRMKLDTQPTDLNSVVQQVVDFYHPQAEASGVRLVLQMDPASRPVPLDSMLFKQALLNLLINATQAMVEARYSGRPHGGANDLFLRTHTTPDGVELHVIDTGPGIEKESIGKIFQPYFSTKKNGSGLGLATTRRIVEEHGGTIRLHSDLGRGSDFVVILPRDRAA